MNKSKISLSETTLPDASNGGPSPRRPAMAHRGAGHHQRRAGPRARAPDRFYTQQQPRDPPQSHHPRGSRVLRATVPTGF